MNSIVLFFLITILALAFVFAPISLIWSLNTLFPTLAIQYTFKTWCASFFIVSLFSASALKLNTKQQ